MCESYLDKYINVVTWPPKQKIPGSAPDFGSIICVTYVLVAPINGRLLNYLARRNCHMA